MLKGFWLGEMIYLNLEGLLDPDPIALEIFEITDSGDVKSFLFIESQSAGIQKPTRVGCEKILMCGNCVQMPAVDGRTEKHLLLNGRERNGKEIELSLKTKGNFELKGEFYYKRKPWQKAELIFRKENGTRS